MEFSADELSEMRTAQTGHMMDTCVIQTCTQTANSYGEMIETFTDGTALDCGLDMRPGSERRGMDATLVEYDAVLRLAISQAPDARSRIKVTKRFGEVLSTALVYEIVSPIQRGPSGIRLILKKVLT
jgi:head-tail adaptor